MILLKRGLKLAIKMDISINEILKNVSKVPKYRNPSPGTLIVFVSNAFPILTRDDTSSIVFAAAKVGALGLLCLMVNG